MGAILGKDLILFVYHFKTFPFADHSMISNIICLEFKQKWRDEKLVRFGWLLACNFEQYRHKVGKQVILLQELDILTLQDSNHIAQASNYEGLEED